VGLATTEGRRTARTEQGLSEEEKLFSEPPRKERSLSVSRVKDLGQGPSN